MARDADGLVPCLHRCFGIGSGAGEQHRRQTSAWSSTRSTTRSTTRSSSAIRERSNGLGHCGCRRRQLMATAIDDAACWFATRQPTTPARRPLGWERPWRGVRCPGDGARRPLTSRHRRQPTTVDTCGPAAFSCCPKHLAQRLLGLLVPSMRNARLPTFLTLRVLRSGAR